MNAHEMLFASLQPPATLKELEDTKLERDFWRNIAQKRGDVIKDTFSKRELVYYEKHALSP